MSSDVQQTESDSDEPTWSTSGSSSTSSSDGEDLSGSEIDEIDEMPGSDAPFASLPLPPVPVDTAALEQLEEQKKANAVIAQENARLKKELEDTQLSLLHHKESTNQMQRDLTDQIETLRLQHQQELHQLQQLQLQQQQELQQLQLQQQTSPKSQAPGKGSSGGGAALIAEKQKNQQLTEEHEKQAQELQLLRSTVAALKIKMKKLDPHNSATNSVTLSGFDFTNSKHQTPIPVMIEGAASIQLRSCSRTAIAVFSYEATKSSQLSFKEGDKLNLLQEKGQWWKAELQGKVGLVPSNYIQLLDAPSPSPSPAPSPAQSPASSSSTSVPLRSSGQGIGAIMQTLETLKKPSVVNDVSQHLEVIEKRTSHFQNEMKKTLSVLQDDLNKTIQQYKKHLETALDDLTAQALRHNSDPCDIFPVGDVFEMKRLVSVEIERAAVLCSAILIPPALLSDLELIYSTDEEEGRDCTKATEEDKQNKKNAVDDKKRLAKERKEMAQQLIRNENFSVGTLLSKNPLFVPFIQLSSSLQSRLKGVDGGLIKVQAVVRSWVSKKRLAPTFKRNRMRAHVAKEVLETERTYCSGLQTMIDVWKKPMEDEIAMIPNVGPMKHIGNLAYIGAKDILKIFSNIELILNMNRELCSQLEDRIDRHWFPDQVIGDIFLEMGPFLKLYIQYVNNYEMALETLEKLEKNPIFTAIMKKRNHEASHKTNGLTLHSFLIMPIQRVPRYSLLLRELLRYTPETHPDFVILSQAMEKISQVATTINESKRDEESKRKVRQVSDLLNHKCENLMEPHRRFVFQAEVLTDSQSFCQPLQRDLSPDFYNCTLFLFNDLLVIATRPRIQTFKNTIKKLLDEEVTYRFQEQMQLHSSSVGTLPQSMNNDLFGFFVQMDRRAPDHFYLRTLEERDEWINHIQTQISESKHRLKSLRVDSDTKAFDPWALQSVVPISQHHSHLQSPSPSPSPSPAPSSSSSSSSGSSSSNLSVPSPSRSQSFSNTRVSPTSSASSSDLSGPITGMKHSLSAENLRYPTIRENIQMQTEALALLQEIFKTPIELQSILPEYCQTLPPGFISQLQNRLSLLTQKLSQLHALHDDAISLLRQDKITHSLNTAILGGKPHLLEFYNWIKTNFPTDTSDKPPRSLLKGLISWYNELTTAWQTVLDQQVVLS